MCFAPPIAAAYFLFCLKSFMQIKDGPVVSLPGFGYFGACVSSFSFL
jgi:hypothetical protein